MTCQARLHIHADGLQSPLHCTCGIPELIRFARHAAADQRHTSVHVDLMQQLNMHVDVTAACILADKPTYQEPFADAPGLHMI